jgi:hypothetical protein
MSNQPEALRLADRLQCNVSRGIHWDAATELRRLHALNGELLEVAKLALRMGVYGGVSPSTVEDAARAALEQPEQEPVAWLRKNGFRFSADIEPQDDSELPLYTHPPRREWRSLSEEEMKDLWAAHGYKSAMCKPFARAIEAALRSKNHE